MCIHITYTVACIYCISVFSVATGVLAAFIQSQTKLNYLLWCSKLCSSIRVYTQNLKSSSSPLHCYSLTCPNTTTITTQPGICSQCVGCNKIKSSCIWSVRRVLVWNVGGESRLYCEGYTQAQDNIIIQYEIHKPIHICAYTVTKTLQQLAPRSVCQICMYLCIYNIDVGIYVWIY